MVREMTEGKPLRLILGFCVPLLLGNLFQQLYNMVDTIIVGRFIGVDALAAVGATGSISFLVIGFLVGLTNGFAIPIAQAFGAGSREDMRKYVVNALYLCAAASVLLTALTMLTTRPLLELMQTPDNIIDQSYSYIIVIFGGIAPLMLYNMLACILRSLGDSRSPLLFLVIASVLNVILDFVLVVIFPLGVAGAGWATIISQGISAILCLLYIRWKMIILHPQKGEWKFETRRCYGLIRIGVPMALQFSITAVGSILLQSAVNTLGSGAVAAVTAANKVQIFCTQPLETLGITMATYCGQNLGAGKIDRVRQGIRQGTVLILAVAVLMAATVMIAGPYILLLFMDAAETEIIAQATRFNIINALFFVVLGLLFIYRNSLQGMGFSLMPMLGGLSEMVARTLVAFLLVKPFGFDAVCFASPVAWVFATVLLLVTYVVKMKGLNQKFEQTPQIETASAQE